MLTLYHLCTIAVAVGLAQVRNFTREPGAEPAPEAQTSSNTGTGD